MEVESVLLEEFTKPHPEPAAEAAAECLDGQEEAARGIDPAGAVRSKAARRPRSGYEDDDTHVHNTLSAENAEVQVFYPFHPLYGATVQILRKPKRGDGAVSVIDQAGKRLKIPVWMLSPDSSGIKISERVHLSKEALLSLTSLLSPHAGEDRGHDNLLPTVVDGGKGGHRGAIGAVGPDGPRRKRNRARRCDSARRSGRSDGSHSGGGISGERRKG